MVDMNNSRAEQQKKLVLAGYVIQIVVMLITFGMPLVIIVPIIYLIVIRRFVSIDWLRRHIHWQLLTVGIGLAILLIATMFLSVERDQPADDADGNRFPVDRDRALHLSAPLADLSFCTRFDFLRPGGGDGSAMALK